MLAVTRLSKEMTMSRVPLLDPKTATGDRKDVLDQITGAFGVTPAMFRAVANSPAALKMMWAGFGALGGGTLGAKLGEQIAVLVADRNACEYCLAAHTMLGKKAGASAEEMSDAQAGHSQDPRTAAALAFVAKLVLQRGQVADADVDALRAAGFQDEQVVEIVAHVALNLFTNYVNVALAVPVDFPAVKLRKAA
ncbi:putative peroxidase-related enzyme [Sphingomonas zeicaulis]|uniref:carboxymuconolactone decarboxylase family protein n=1 Tax=Sphingomonas zeicaulis TaxID=1632740 RepID=UPI003D2242F3